MSAPTPASMLAWLRAERAAADDRRAVCRAADDAAGLDADLIIRLAQAGALVDLEWIVHVLELDLIALVEAEHETGGAR